MTDTEDFEESKLGQIWRHVPSGQGPIFNLSMYHNRHIKKAIIQIVIVELLLI